MFTVALKAVRFIAKTEPGSRCKLLNLMAPLFVANRRVVTESWCVLSQEGTLVCTCVCEEDANMIEISLNNRAAR